jgi:hypothetical protein
VANYRSAFQYVEQAKLRSIEQGRTWTDNVQLAFGKVKRASNRGIGVPRATAPYPVHDIKDLYNFKEPRCVGGPCWPRRADLAGSWWACRSIELANAVVADVAFLPNREVSWELPSSKTDQAALGASRSHQCSCGTVPGTPTIATQDMCTRCVLLQQVDWVSKVFQEELANEQQVQLLPTTTGDFISTANMVTRVEIGATSLGKSTHGRAGAYLWGGHAYRRGIVHHLALSGVEVSRMQSLLRHSSTSKAILRYLGKSMARSSAGLAEEAALGTTLNSVRAEIKTLAAQLRSQQIAAAALQNQQRPTEISNLTATTQCHPCPTTSQYLNNRDQSLLTTIPPPTTLAFVVCAREILMKQLHVRRPRESGVTYCNWAFLASTWASVAQDIRNDITLGTRDWCPRCAAFYIRSTNEDQAGRIDASSSSQSTNSSSSS